MEKPTLRDSFVDAQSDAVDATLADLDPALLAIIGARYARTAPKLGIVVEGMTDLELARASILAGQWTGDDGKPATAASLTRAAKFDGIDSDESEDGIAIAAFPAMRYALNRDVTGALPVQKMRVRARSGGTVSLDRPATLPSDAVIGQRFAARAVAIREIETLIATINSSSGALKKSAISKVRAQIKAWSVEGVNGPVLDSQVAEALRYLGWRL